MFLRHDEGVDDVVHREHGVRIHRLRPGSSHSSLQDGIIRDVIEGSTAIHYIDGGVVHEVRHVCRVVFHTVLVEGSVPGGDINLLAGGVLADAAFVAVVVRLVCLPVGVDHLHNVDLAVDRPACVVVREEPVGRPNAVSFARNAREDGVHADPGVPLPGTFSAAFNGPRGDVVRTPRDGPFVASDREAAVAHREARVRPACVAHPAIPVPSENGPCAFIQPIAFKIIPPCFNPSISASTERGMCTVYNAQ